MDNEIKKKLLDFFADKIGIEINDRFQFFDDTGIDGYDAAILMKEFGEEFNVDMTNFVGKYYYSNEHDLMNFPKRIFQFWKNKNESKYFDIAHCINVVEKGQWFDMGTTSKV